MLPEWIFQAWPSLRCRMKSKDDALVSGEAAYPFAALQKTEVLAELLDEFAKRYPRRKKAAIVSQWSMNYMSVCLPTLLLPVVVVQRGEAIDIQSLSLVNVEGVPQALWLPNQHIAVPERSLYGYYQALVDNHFSVLLSSLSQVGRVSEKMLWSNFAIIWDNLFHRLQSRPELAAVAADAKDWWYQAQLSDRSLHLNRFIRLVESPVPEIRQELPLRSNCCLHFMLHDRVEGQQEVLCESCPRFHRWPLDEKVRYLHEIYES